ncbi:MAG: hypothetical protein LBG09_02660 [Puniceicoccales bacterium]|nr:hypothetical protein [Puniceicoccales bacterium]
MPGFVANSFADIEGEFLQIVSRFDPLSPLPSAIICPSAVEIKFVKYFFATQQISLANAHFYTSQTLMAALWGQIFPGEHIMDGRDIKLLVQNGGFFGDHRVLAKIFLEEFPAEIDACLQKVINFLTQQCVNFRWSTPRQALQKMAAAAQPIFESCVLLGYSSPNPSPSDFLAFVKKLSKNVIYFTFNRNDGERNTLNALEMTFGRAQNIENISQKRENFNTKFSIVGDSVDAARCCSTALAAAEIAGTTAIICSADAHAQLVAHELDALRIPYHSGFSRKIFDATDSVVSAWYQFQLHGNFECFLHFLDIIRAQNRLPFSGDDYKYLSFLFHRYPIDSVERLAPWIEDPQINAILLRYPLLPGRATVDEFVQKTAPIFPEIREKISHFPSDFCVQKGAFLEYVLAVHRAAKPPAKEPFFCPIFIVDMPTATRLHFEHIIVFCDKTAPNDAAAPDNFEDLFPLLSAKNLHLIAEKNNIPIYFAQHYKNIHRQILDAPAIQMLSRFFVFPAADYDPAPYEILSKINAQRSNKLENFGPFEYAAGSLDTENLSIPITAIERAFTDPEAIWYRYVAQNDRPPLRFEKQKFDGIFTHSLLHWPSEIRPTREAFRAHIAQKQKHRQHILEQFSPGLLLRDTLNGENPYILAEKIVQWDDFPFMASECDLQSTFPLENGITIPLHGRADCILSQFPLRRRFHKDNADNRLLVIDLKTGSATQSDLLKFAKPFAGLPPSLSGLQLVLYGLILENFGYKNIRLLILNGDPYERAEPIALRSITQGENFPFIKNFLKNLIVKGIFGYGESNSFQGRHFSSPAAVIPPNNAVIREKRKKLFWTF